MTFLLFSYIMGIEVITMKIGDKVVVSRHKTHGDGSVCHEVMIGAKGVIVGFHGSKASVEVYGEEISVVLRFELEQLDVING